VNKNRGKVEGGEGGRGRRRRGRRREERVGGEEGGGEGREHCERLIRYQLVVGGEGSAIKLKVRGMRTNEVSTFSRCLSWP
jgi:hypothetical protein